MKKSRFTEEQVAYALRQTESGTAVARGVALDFTRPGKPTDNGYIESFNARLRDECLNVHQFTSLDYAKAVIEAWRIDCNEHRPHGSLGHLTATQYAATCQATGASVAA